MCCFASSLWIFFFNFLEIKFISLIFDIFLNILTFFQIFFQFQTVFCVFQDLLVLIETIFQMRIFEMQIFPTQAIFHNKKKSPLALYFKTVCCFACILMWISKTVLLILSKGRVKTGYLIYIYFFNFQFCEKYDCLLLKKIYFLVTFRPIY